jgi:hypothetical protein
MQAKVHLLSPCPDVLARDVSYNLMFAMNQIYWWMRLFNRISPSVLFSVLYCGNSNLIFSPINRHTADDAGAGTRYHYRSRPGTDI